jgi:hypothetical protein
MTTILELLKTQLASGRPISVEFTLAVVDLEDYSEPGMRANVVRFTRKQDGVLELSLDFAPFDEHNKTLEQSNYYDKDGVARLNAREAGQYKPQMSMYVMDHDAADKYFTLLEPDHVLVDEWRQAGTSQTYLAWMETQLAQARAVDGWRLEQKADRDGEVGVWACRDGSSIWIAPVEQAPAPAPARKRKP